MMDMLNSNIKQIKRHNIWFFGIYHTFSMICCSFFVTNTVALRLSTLYNSERNVQKKNLNLFFTYFCRPCTRYFLFCILATGGVQPTTNPIILSFFLVLYTTMLFHVVLLYYSLVLSSHVDNSVGVTDETSHQQTNPTENQADRNCIVFAKKAVRL